MEVVNKKLSDSLEDYLEVIFNLLERSEVARSKDIACQLGVSKPSVTGALRMLSQKGLINYKPYGYITLTDKGRHKASLIARKHDAITKFFVDILGIDRKTAQDAACKAEHSLGQQIISRLTSFTEFISLKNIETAENFKKYYNRKIENN